GPNGRGRARRRLRGRWNDIRRSFRRRGAGHRTVQRNHVIAVFTRSHGFRVSKGFEVGQACEREYTAVSYPPLDQVTAAIVDMLPMQCRAAVTRRDPETPRRHWRAEDLLGSNLRSVERDVGRI